MVLDAELLALALAVGQEGAEVGRVRVVRQQDQERLRELERAGELKSGAGELRELRGNIGNEEPRSEESGFQKISSRRKRRRVDYDRRSTFMFNVEYFFVTGLKSRSDMRPSILSL